MYVCMCICMYQAYLAWYKSSFVSKAINSNPVRALKLNGCSRFINDMVCLNDGFEFEKHRSEICPKDLELKCEHLGTSATFLEHDVAIQNNIFLYKLFDKRDAFPFSIVRMPDLSSNIPSSAFYGAVFLKLLRIGRVTLLFDDFVPKASQLYQRMCLQGGSRAKLNLLIGKSLRKHPGVFEKFDTTPEDIISQIINHDG